MKKVLVMVIALVLALSFGVVAEEEETCGWENILLLGGDSRSSDSYRLTDTMMILSINRDEAMVKMTSIMRDTWVEFPGLDKKGKINAANVYGGPELAIQTVNNNFGTDIEDYVIVNMEDLKEIVDMLGGVTVEITEAEKNKINASGGSVSNSGSVWLDGSEALAYCRIRSIDSDYKRVMRQQNVLIALAAKAQDMDVDDLMKVAEDIFEIVNTSLEKDELENLATALMVVEVDDIKQNRIPVDGTFDSGMFSGTWMIKADFAKNRELLKEFIYGE